MMEPIEITVRIDTTGQVYPIRFLWREQDNPVISIGRQWISDQGRHILVMIAGDRVIELLFAATQGIWYLVTPPGSTAVT